MSGLCCPGSLPALSAARTVPCVLNPKRIQSLLLSSSGGLIWLTNEHFPNEGNSSPQSHHSLYTSFAHFCPYLCAFFSSAPTLISRTCPLPPLPQALVSIFLHPLVSAVPVHILHTVYISLLSLADSHSPTVCHLFSFSSIHRQLY